MANSISSVTTGTGGIVLESVDTSGNTNIKSGTTTIVAVSSTGAAVTGTLSSTGNTTLGDASTDTLNVGNGNLVTDASGNVGVGVTPSAWYSTQKAIDIVSGSIMSAGTTAMQVLANAYFNASGVWTYKNTAASSRYYQSAGTHGWSVAPSGTAGNAITWTEAMTLDNSGNLGIGTTPSYKLHVQGAANDIAAFKRDTGSILYLYNDKNNIGMFSAANGTVDGIYMDAVNHTLEFYANSGTRMSISSAGVATIHNLAGTGSRAVNASAVGALSAASDSSLKQEVTGISIAGLAEILQLTPRTYKWLDDIAIRGDDAAVELGFFANEVAPIIPSAAPKCEDGLYGFYDRSVTAALVKAIQELKAIVDTQAEQIKALQGAK